MSTRPAAPPSKAPSWSLLLFLQWISILPAAWGSFYCLWQATTGVSLRREMARDGLGLVGDDSRTSRLDYAVAFVWSAASGYWCLSLSSGLLRRWLVYYDLSSAVLRLVSLHGIVFTSTHLTVVRVISANEPILAWSICAFSAAICNTIQLWVTSNIRLTKNKDQLASWVSSVPTLRATVIKRSTTVIKPEKRRLSVDKVVRRTVLPLACMSFVTMLVLMWELSSERAAAAHHSGHAREDKLRFSHSSARSVSDGVLGTEHDPWIIPNVLSTKSSVFSRGQHWHHVYATTFLHEPAQFARQHLTALDSIWVQDPSATVFVLSPSLPAQFFDFYRRRGYRIWVVNVTSSNIEQWRWTYEHRLPDWLALYERREDSAVRRCAEAYLRYVWMAIVGGTWFDLDAITLRLPSDKSMQFVSTPPSLPHKLHVGLLASPAYMRLQHGWGFMRKAADGILSSSCRADADHAAVFEKHYTEAQRALASFDVLQLPRQLTDPFYRTFGEHIPTLEDAARLSFSTAHLNTSTAGAASLLQGARNRLSLDFPLEGASPLQLVIPTKFAYQYPIEHGQYDKFASELGAFDGADVLSVRGGPQRYEGKTVIRATCAKGRLALNAEFSAVAEDDKASSGGSGWSSAFDASWTVYDHTVGDVNRLLAALNYVPPSGRKGVLHDTLTISVKMGKEEVSGTVAIIITA